MSVMYQPHKDEHIDMYVGRHTEAHPLPPGTIKKSTMYIIVALSVLVTSMMFASTATVVYLVASATDKSSADGSDHGPGVPTHASGNPDVVATTSGVKRQSGGQTQTQVPETTRTTPQPAVVESPQVPVEKSIAVTYFTRWGKTECTSNSEVLYTGYTVGSRYNYYGGTSNVLCLPKDPQYKSLYAGASGNYLYGSEYNARNTNLQALFGKDLNEHDVPCAVCEATGSSTMMIPARTECYGNWTKQYSGYLMTSHESHNKSMDIVCIDEAPEVVPGQDANNNGALLYFVEVNGQLPASTYTRGAELTCVVCSK